MSRAVRVRPMVEGDVERAAHILLTAFGRVYRHRGHVPPFPNVESAAWLCRAYLDLDPDGCAVAETAGTLAGVGFVHPRGRVASVGPVAAQPGAPVGVGRAIMEYLERLTSGCESRRLFQDSFNPDSFGLYTRLGYVVRDVAPYLLATEIGARGAADAAFDLPPRVRAFALDDLSRVQELDRRLVTADRGRDLALLASVGAALVYERNHALEGYLFYRALPTRSIVGPGVAVDEDTLLALIDGASRLLAGRSAVMRPSGSSVRVLQRAFDLGFRVDHLGNLMVTGEASLPPSQLYALFPESL